MAPVLVWFLVATAASAAAIRPNAGPVDATLGRRPFTAIWNAPIENCMGHFGVDLNLTGYGIVNKSVIFYHDQLGLYPAIKDGVISNGGLPQVVNLTSHLEKATEDIASYIPDVNYDGIAVIDWEYWQPIWEANQAPAEAIYKSASVRMVQNRHPDWNSTLVEQVARLEFEQAAHSLFASTLRLATQLRPSALWGFYHFPYCMYNTLVGNCTQVAVRSADRMDWLYGKTPALYPSIYLKAAKIKSKKPVEFVESVLMEAFRVRRNPSQPVLAYFRYKYTRTDFYLTLEHLKDTVLLSAEMGVSGIVIWVSSEDCTSEVLCQQVRAYMQAALGPLVQATMNAAAKCSQSLCGGHGRCVGKIMTCTRRAPSSVDALEHRPSPAGRAGGFWEPFYLRRTANAVKIPTSAYGRKSKDTCTCQCFEGWSGPGCSSALKGPIQHW